jgi:putative glutamine amidotransferase
MMYKNLNAMWRLGFMSKIRPMIGITPWYDYEKNLTYIKKGYFEGILNAGGMPVLLPVTTDDAVLGEFVQRVDGFVVSGGPDIDANLYGENNLLFNGEISPHRDHMEIFIVKSALKHDKPILGICRGIQIMNVAAGGSLYQDIYSQIKGNEIVKHLQQAPRWYPTHEIFIVPGSKINGCFKKDRIKVNSFHHQSVKEVAKGFIVTSKAQDGIIESIEHSNHRFAVGVQWHPELMWQEDAAHLKLFEDFVKAAEGKA